MLNGGDDAALTAGTTTSETTSSVAPTSSVGFEAPPPRPPLTAAPTTVASTTTSTAASTSTAAPASTTSTTAAPDPVAARPGPTVETTSGNHGAMRAAIASARSRWAANRPPDGYRYRTRPVCFCPTADNEITVGDDGVVRSQRTIEGDAEEDPPTIDEVFAVLEDAVAENPDLVRASFDLNYGYPVEFFVDHDERLADEEHGREIEWLAEL